MKGRGFFLALVSLLVLLGCSSDDSDDNGNQKSEYYFRFKVDGSQISYDYLPESQINLTGSILFDSGTGNYVASIAGIEDVFETDPLNRVTLFLSDSADMATEVDYTNIVGEGDRTPSSVFLMSYYDEQGNLYSAALNTGPTALYESASVTFTEITETKISGTFYGTLLLYDLSGRTVELLDTLVVSEGVFAVPRY